MKKNASELCDRALDYAVALALGTNVHFDDRRLLVEIPNIIGRDFATGWGYKPFRPSQGALGENIIDREGIATRRDSKGRWFAMLSSDLGDGQAASWVKETCRGGERYGPASFQVHKRQIRFEGDTRLQAAMRAFVAAKLGAVIDVPRLVFDSSTVAEPDDEIERELSERDEMGNGPCDEPLESSAPTG